MSDHKHDLKVQPRGVYELICDTVCLRCSICGGARWYLRRHLYRILQGKSAVDG